MPLQRFRVLFALVVREMGTKFGRSYGGYLWAIAEPLGGIVVLAIVFGMALRSPPLGSNFMIFYATGTIPYMVFNKVSGAVSGGVRSNTGLLTYPVVTALDAVFARFILNAITLFVVALVLYPAIIFVYGLNMNLDLGTAAVAFGLSAVLGLGVGTVNCVIGGFFPTWRNVWNVLTRPLFILSGVFYLYESVPPAFQAVLWYNPLVHVIGMMRSAFFGAYDPQYTSPAYVLGVSLVCFVIGAHLLRRHATFLIEG